MLTNVDNCIIAKSKKPIQTEIFACECGKVYKHRQSLSVHKKKCNFVDNSYDEPEEVNTITTENETKSNTIVMKKLLTMLDQQQEVNQKLSKTNEE